MIIGHAPAGYITADLLHPKFAGRHAPRTTFFIASILGALMPDIDMFYFHLVDHRQHHHHSYFTHFPIFWLCLLALSAIWLRIDKNSKNAVLAFLFGLGGFIHLVLDTVVGDIWWLAPFVDRPFSMFSVPARYHPWWLNFLLHWSFALELALWIGAFFLYRSRRLKS